MLSLFINIILIILALIIGIPILGGIVIITPMVIGALLQFGVLVLIFPGACVNYLLKYKLKWDMNDDTQATCIFLVSLVVDCYVGYLLTK